MKILLEQHGIFDLCRTGILRYTKSKQPIVKTEVAVTEAPVAIVELTFVSVQTLK